MMKTMLKLVEDSFYLLEEEGGANDILYFFKLISLKHMPSMHPFGLIMGKSKSLDRLKRHTMFYRMAMFSLSLTKRKVWVVSCLIT